MFLTFKRTIIRRVIVASASLAVDQWGIAEQALWALIVLVALLAAAFAPDLLVDVQLIIDCQLVLQVLISLLDDSLYH
jgi:hypothetical protein